MSRLRGHQPGLTSGFPRVSGDEPKRQKLLSSSDRFSPRERG